MMQRTEYLWTFATTEVNHGIKRWQAAASKFKAEEVQFLEFCYQCNYFKKMHCSLFCCILWNAMQWTVMGLYNLLAVFCKQGRWKCLHWNRCFVQGNFKPVTGWGKPAKNATVVNFVCT